jgi:hypothetical protein
MGIPLGLDSCEAWWKKSPARFPRVELGAMPFKNIARYGYQQTVAGAWDAGGGNRITFGIEDPRAERFTIEIFGPTTQAMREAAERRQRVSAATGISLEGTSADDAGAGLRPQLSGGGAVAFLLVSAVNIANSFNVQHKIYTRILRTAFALGAPITHGDLIEEERKRETFRSALRHRGTRGLGDLTWIADQYMSLIDEGPYFAEDNGRKWWESGIIAIPQKVPAAAGSSANYPTDMFMRVRTDLYGKELYLQIYTTYQHRITGSTAMVLSRVTTDLIYNPDDVATVQAWER